GPGEGRCPIRCRVLASVLALKQLPLPPAHWAGPCTPQVPPPQAGQNKWSKVKHIKGLRDTEPSRLFQKLAMLLRFARKAGGPNPDFNTNLANLTEQCRSMVLTKASTEVAIKGRAGCWSASDPGPTAPRPGDGPKGGTLDRAVAGLGANGRGTARNPGCSRYVDGMDEDELSLRIR
ncbi:unnamed protein product, partial [Lepidochelys olivacea]